jgi:hypothetical protein
VEITGDKMEDSLIQQISELKEKAQRYDNVKRREDDAVKKLNMAAELLTEVITMLNPTFTSTAHGPRLKYTEQLDEQYKKLQVGMEITTNSLHKDYPELDDRQVLALYMRIRKAPDVMVRRNGRERFLYLTKSF